MLEGPGTSAAGGAAEGARRRRPAISASIVVAVALALLALVLLRPADDDRSAPGGAPGSDPPASRPGGSAGSTRPVDGTRTSTAAATTTTVRPPPPSHTVSVYGAAGTFRGLTPDVTKTSSGHDIAAVAVPNWQFDPGQSAFFASMTAGGRVVMGTVPQTDNQTAPTGSTMSVGVFDPVSALGPSFRSLDIPTDRGALNITTPGEPTGGADVSDLCAVPTPDGPRVWGFSALPYKGWDFTVTGTWPAVVGFRDEPGVDGAAGVAIDPAYTHTAEQLRASAGVGAVAFNTRTNEYGTWAETRGLGECDTTPRGNVIVSQYFFGQPPTLHSGSVVVFRPDGRVLAFLPLPDAVLAAPLTLDRSDSTPLVVPAGATLELSPREVRADPHTTAADDQRFVVIYDALVPDPEHPDQRLPTPFALQEFRLDESRGTISASSAPVVTTDRRRVPADGTTQVVRANSVTYAPDGTLFVTRSPASGAASLIASTVAVFRPGALGGRTGEPSPWGVVVTPDAVLASTADGANPLTTVRAIDFDDATGSVLMVSGVDARLRAFRWNGWDADRARPETPYCDVDLGGLLLANPRPGYRQQVRQGVIDTARHLYYVPYQGLQPSFTVTNNEVLPQYLFEVKLDDVLAPANEVGSCGR